MRHLLIITLKILRVLLIIIFLGVIILWILSAFLGWDLGYLEPLSILILAPFSAAGAWLSNLGTKKLQELIDQSTTIVNTKIEGDLVQGNKIETNETVYGDKFSGDKVMGDLIQEQNIYQTTMPEGPPMQIPRTAEYFQGREQLIEDVLAVLQSGRVVSLIGIGGIGKTAVTAEVVKRLLPAEGLPERFPDGIIFHSFYGQPNTDIALDHILNSLHIERQGHLDDNVRAALGGKKLLLILDGAEEADDLARVVTLAPTCAVLISSRKKEDIFDEGFFVKCLEQEDSEIVLARWAGDRIDDAQAGREICERLGNLPLAVRLAGKYLATSGLLASEYLHWLHVTELEALDFGRRRRDSVPVLLAHSVAQVGEGARQALAVAGSLALAPFQVEAVAAALDKPRTAAQNDLGELFNFGLLERPDASYLVTHPLVHTFARRKMNLDWEQLLNLAAYYTTFTDEQSTKGPDGFVRLDTERAHIMQLLKAYEQNNAWDAVEEMILAIDRYLDRQGHVSERITALKAGARAAKVLDNRQNEALYLGRLGIAYAKLGQVEKAIDYFEQALAIAEEIGDRRGEGAQLGNLGLAYHNLGEVNKAIDYHEQALAIAQEIGNRLSEGNQLGNLGIAYRNLGQVEKAIEYHQQALVISKQIGDKLGEGHDLANLGFAYRDLGQVERTREYWQKALAIYQEIQSPWAENAQQWLDDLDKA